MEDRLDTLGDRLSVQAEVALQDEHRVGRQAAAVDRDRDGLQLLVRGGDVQSLLSTEVQFEPPVAVGEHRDGVAPGAAVGRLELAVLHQGGELREDHQAEQGVRLVGALLPGGLLEVPLGVLDVLRLAVVVVLQVGDLVDRCLEVVEDELVGLALLRVRLLRRLFGRTQTSLLALLAGPLGVSVVDGREGGDELAEGVGRRGDDGRVGCLGVLGRFGHDWSLLGR